MADSINGRVIRFDDMSAANWTMVAPSLLPMYSEPLALTVDAASRIYISYDEFAISEVVRIDDISGTNPAYFGLGTPNYLYYIYQRDTVLSVKRIGIVFAERTWRVVLEQRTPPPRAAVKRR